VNAITDTVPPDQWGPANAKLDRDSGGYLTDQQQNNGTRWMALSGDRPIDETD
jgi:hypothetical protein